MNPSTMNLAILPKEIQDMIYEYNVEHRPQMRIVLKELLKKYKSKIYLNNRCSYCRIQPNRPMTKYILWKKYTFCSEWCSFNEEYDMLYTKAIDLYYSDYINNTFPNERKQYKQAYIRYIGDKII